MKNTSNFADLILRFNNFIFIRTHIFTFNVECNSEKSKETKDNLHIKKKYLKELLNFLLIFNVKNFNKRKLDETDYHT